jgi:tetratricopeptide (TPR) repeat protein
MVRGFRLRNIAVAAAASLLLGLGAAQAEDSAKLDGLFQRLKSAEADEAARIANEIWTEWTKSGSPAMDLLLSRGHEALSAGDVDQAIAHFTALVDHAPDFAEGWNARATAYYQAGQFGPSIADIARTLELNPRHFGALSGFGMILEETEQPERALEVYRAALALYPHLEGVTQAVERLEIALQGQDL